MECGFKGCKNIRLLITPVSYKPYYQPWCKKHWCLKTGKKRLSADRVIYASGYALIRVNGKFKPEHREVMARVLGRPLARHENVHHINGNRSDNRPENLELWVRVQPTGARATELFCPHCQKPYLKKSYN